MEEWQVRPLPEEFRRRMDRLLGGEAGREFLEAYASAPLRRGLRVNTLKVGIDRFQALFPLALEPIPFSPAGFSLPSPHRAGADPLHHAGAYYMQEPSAMSAVTALAPRSGERVLDLCAAPGGKSTQIAACLEGRGLLWCNEYVRCRTAALQQNLERCGVTNAVVSSCAAGPLCDELKGFFDAVLADAPCSGEGMFRKEPAALEHWSMDNIRLCAARQREILAAAAAAVRPGGRLVFSTCTFAPEENEGNVAWFLRQFPDFRLTDLSGCGFGRPGCDFEAVKPFLPPEEQEEPPAPLSRCRRIFPADGGEGHFVALFRRAGDADREDSREAARKTPVKPDRFGEDFRRLYADCFSDAPRGVIRTFGGRVRLLPEALPELTLKGLLTAGIPAAEVRTNRLEPCHGLFMAAPAAACRRLLTLSLDDERGKRFLRGESLPAPGCPDGWTAVALEGLVTGFGKVTGGVLKNRYPKGLRLLG